jgi:hypothetical protein
MPDDEDELAMPHHHGHDHGHDDDGDDDDNNEFLSGPGCLPRFLRRFFGRRTRLDEDLDAIDELEDNREITPEGAGCLRLVVIATGICVFTLLGFLGIDLGDSTSKRIIVTTVGPTVPSGAIGAPGVAAIVGGYVHGPNVFHTPSRDQVCAVITNVTPGDHVTFSGQGGEGPLTVMGTVGAGGRVLAEGGISQYGTKVFSMGYVTNAGTNATEPLQLSSPLSINVQGGPSMPCDPLTLPEAPSHKSLNGPSVPESSSTKIVTTTTESFPWSLVAAGGLDLALVGLAFGGRRDKDEVTTYPDWKRLEVA